MEIGKTFYILGVILAYVLAVIIIIQLIKILFGGSWSVEDVILGLVVLNLSLSFGILGYLLHVNTSLNNKIAKVDAKLTGHFGWHKGKDEEYKK